MSTYSLSGSGVQALSAGVTAAHITITTTPTNSREGSANPANLYDVAMLRFGDATGFFDAIPVVGGPQWLAVPSGTTRLGYACKGGAVISFAEVIGGVPPFGGGGALSGLSDVALSSPADAQVLTYQSSSSKWINASGGGGGGALTYFEDNLAAEVTLGAAGVESTILSRSLGAGTWLLFAEVVSYSTSASVHNVSARLYSGSTVLKQSFMSALTNTMVPSTALFAIAVLSATTTCALKCTDVDISGTKIGPVFPAPSSVGDTRLLSLKIA